MHASSHPRVHLPRVLGRSSGARPPSCPRCTHQAGSVGLPDTRLAACAPLPYAPEDLFAPRDAASTSHQSARPLDSDRLQRAARLLDGSSARASRSSTAEAISTPQDPALRALVCRAARTLPRQLPNDVDRLQGLLHRRVRCADRPLPACQHPILPWVLFPSEARPGPPLTPSRVARHSTSAFDGGPIPRDETRRAAACVRSRSRPHAKAHALPPWGFLRQRASSDSQGSSDAPLGSLNRQIGRAHV